jgi:hypothetical protein
LAVDEGVKTTPLIGSITDCIGLHRRRRCNWRGRRGLCQQSSGKTK